MDRRFAFPGSEVDSLKEATPPNTEIVDTADLRSGVPWDQYLDDPELGRLGICCSGGGIRSASYSLGALQVLRREGVLGQAAHLAAVSGGDYIAIAHVVLVSETLGPDNASPFPEDEASGRRTKEEQFFGDLPPWAPLSPEEQHLRDHTTYLAPGLQGKAWLGINLLYGLVRHLVPSAAGILLLATAFGVAFGRWVGPTLRHTPGHRAISYACPIWLIVALGLVIGGLLLARQRTQTSGRPGGASLAALQSAVGFLVMAQAAVALLLIGLPALLVFLSHRPIDWLHSVLLTTSTLEFGSLALISVLAYLARRGALRKIVPIGTAVIGPLVVAIPFVGVTYWAALRANHFLWRPLAYVLVSGALLAVYWRLDETTPNMHLFYRERLATAFIGLRKAARVGSDVLLEYEQPLWREPIWFTKVVRGTDSARLPNLVVCAAVNVSRDVPPGRLAASFTFERDYSGGPLTGYVPTRLLERTTGGGRLTLPAMMAISGAGVAPSMGKMTRAWARLLLSLFNARLGVWLPNPLHQGSVGPRRIRRLRASGSEPSPDEDDRLGTGSRRGRPGISYVLRESLGLNDLGRPFLYVTDGGHWDNLGLVELLRRGCGQILCFDAAGDDLRHFDMLSDAIALARSDLGVRIDIDVDPLRPGDDGLSPSDHCRGTITYPDGTAAVLVFAKAAMAKDAPQDLKAFREHDPRFPTNSTLDQFFDDRQFESYRALGAHAAAGAVRSLRESRKDLKARASREAKGR